MASPVPLARCYSVIRNRIYREFPPAYAALKSDLLRNNAAPRSVWFPRGLPPMNFLSPSPVPTNPVLPPPTKPSLHHPSNTQSTPPNAPQQAAHTLRLRLLREYDRSRFWNDLSDRRLCLLCDAEFEGSAIRISVRQGKPVFKCPQTHCQAGLAHFVHPGNPLLNEDTWEDWMRPLPVYNSHPHSHPSGESRVEEALYQIQRPAASAADSEPGAAASFADNVGDDAGSVGPSGFADGSAGSGFTGASGLADALGPSVASGIQACRRLS